MEIDRASRLVCLHRAAVELVRLERVREPALAKRLERAQERSSAFPNSVATHEVLNLTVEHQNMLDRIDNLKAMLLLPFRRMEAA